MIKLGKVVGFISVLAVAGCGRLFAAPLVMPATFDKASVQSLIDHIEADHNDTKLKFGYFNGHRSEAFSVVDGYALLQTALDHEKPGTPRWLLLQTVSGWAALRIPGKSHKQEGLGAYEQVFRIADTDAGADIVPVAVYDYVNAVGAGLTGSENGDKAAGLLVTAAGSYLTCERKHPVTWDRRPDWGRACAALGNAGAARFDAWVTGAATKAMKAPNYAELVSLSEMSFPLHLDRAAGLMSVAEPLALKQDAPEIKSFRTFYVDILDGLSRQSGEVFPRPSSLPVKPGERKPWLARAITCQKAIVDAKGGGEGRLTYLYFEKSDAAAFESGIKTLGTPASDEAEVNECAGLLFTFHVADAIATKYAHERAVRLLTQYLVTQRKRSLRGELLARVRLAQWYMGHHDWAGAREYLNDDEIARFAARAQKAEPDVQLLYLTATTMTDELKDPQNLAQSIPLS